MYTALEDLKNIEPDFKQPSRQITYAPSSHLAPRVSGNHFDFLLLVNRHLLVFARQERGRNVSCCMSEQLGLVWIRTSPSLLRVQRWTRPSTTPKFPVGTDQYDQSSDSFWVQSVTFCGMKNDDQYYLTSRFSKNRALLSLMPRNSCVSRISI